MLRLGVNEPLFFHKREYQWMHLLWFRKVLDDIYNNFCPVFCWQAFRTMDSNGKGILTKQDLKNTLHRFILPISKQEFDKLWSRYEFQIRAHLQQALVSTQSSQCCDDVSDPALTENIRVTAEWVATPIWSNSICFHCFQWDQHH